MKPAEALLELAQRLLPVGFGCAVLPLSREPAPLLAEERQAIFRAVPKRQREFAVGRMALRAAIAAAGHDLPRERPILMRADRRPDLPDGMRASISHSGDFCIAIAARTGGPSVGVDLEPCERTLPDGLEEVIQPYRQPADAPSLLGFCVKEAMFKAQYPLTGRMLDFRHVPAVINGRRFRACMGDRLIGGRWGQAGGYLLAISLWRG